MGAGRRDSTKEPLLPCLELQELQRHGDELEPRPGVLLWRQRSSAKWMEGEKRVFALKVEAPGIWACDM